MKAPMVECVLLRNDPSQARTPVSGSHDTAARACTAAISGAYRKIVLQKNNFPTSSQSKVMNENNFYKCIIYSWKISKFIK